MPIWRKTRTQASSLMNLRDEGLSQGSRCTTLTSSPRFVAIPGSIEKGEVEMKTCAWGHPSLTEKQVIAIAENMIPATLRPYYTGIDTLQCCRAWI